MRGFGASRSRPRLIPPRGVRAGRVRLSQPLATGLAVVVILSCGGDEQEGTKGPPSEVLDASRAPAQQASGLLLDAAGRTHRFARPPEGIVSLVPSASAVLSSLGEADRLIGRTDFDTARAIAHLPSVGGGIEPDLERLLALGPELVIRFSGPSDQETARNLDRLGIPHFAVRPDGIEDVRVIIRQMGELTGRSEAADSLLEALDGTLADVRRAVRGRPPTRTAYVLEATPPWVAGPGSFIEELIRLGGGVNVFSDLGALYGQVSLEELLRREVDVYLTRTGSRVDGSILRERPLRELSSLVEMPGPRLGEAAHEVARALHPEAFP